MGKTNVCTIERTYMAQDHWESIRHGDRCMVEETKWTGEQGHLFGPQDSRQTSMVLFDQEANATNPFLLAFACKPYESH